MTATISILKGTLGDDCEIKQTNGGTRLISFRVAVNTKKGGEEITTWYNCAWFGRVADGNMPQYLTKGKQVALTGSFTIRPYPKNDGSTGYSNDVNVTNLALGGERPQQSAPSQQNAPQNTAPTGQGAGFDEFSDDVPF